MTVFRVKKSEIRGSISVPASKSHTLRALLFASLGKGKSVIREYLLSTDARAMIDACKLLGAKVTLLPNRIEIDGIGGDVAVVEDVINSGNSGIVLRFISAIAALSGNYTIITGDHSIRHQRPIRPLLDALSQLGAFAVSSRGDGYAPVIIRGPMKSGRTTIDGLDSQPVSALMIAAAFLDGETEIHVTNPGEKPWILLTLHWLDYLGIPYENHDFTYYKIRGKHIYPGFDYTVPGDFSSAAFPIAAALVTHSEVTINNMDINDIQGDKQLIFVLQEMGAKIVIDAERKSLTVKRGSQLKGQVVDINTFIDAITILAVIACYAEGETRIINAAVARNKECDRIHSIATELKKMGADITELPDSLIIKRSHLKGAHVFSHHDHRMAMSLMVAALGAEGETVITHAECVAKTFPNVAEAFKELGANIEIEP